MSLKVSSHHSKLSRLRDALWPFTREETLALGIIVALYTGVAIGMMGQVAIGGCR